jgi:hypothetical protein
MNLKHMYRFIFILSVLILSLPAAAQPVHTPEKGSPERKEVLDALRVPVEKELKQQIIFAVDNLNVSGNWAFVGGSPQRPSGGQPDYNGTIYEEALDSGAFDNNIFALLKKTAGKWRVVVHQIGCTDVCYATWWKDHRAPKALFPYNY